MEPGLEKGLLGMARCGEAITQAPHRTLLENVSPSWSALTYFEELQIAWNRFLHKGQKWGEVSTGKEGCKHPL